MALYLNTLGRSTLGIGVCQRCWRRFSLDDLHREDATNLLVCDDDSDDTDPYLLPPRGPDPIGLRDYSPDEALDGTVGFSGSVLNALTPTPDPVSTLNDLVIVITVDKPTTTES